MSERAKREGATRPREFFQQKKPQSCEKARVLILKMALQDGGTLSFFMRNVCVFFASFFLKKKMGTFLFF